MNAFSSPESLPEGIGATEVAALFGAKELPFQEEP